MQSLEAGLSIVLLASAAKTLHVADVSVMITLFDKIEQK